MTIDYKAERIRDVKNINDSGHPKKIVVAGPGTGKSYLFSEIIKKKQLEGKTNFLAITFVGKLVDELADDLCGLAKTTTLHGFARSFVLKYYSQYSYYPRMYELIEEDLKLEGIETFEVGDKNYLKKTDHYKAVGDEDVVYYAAKICEKDPNKIPIFDLILVDEYQDFNEMESSFVDLLAQKNEIVIVGDDDQNLYSEFRGSSPSFIREKYYPVNTDWEGHTLRFCSRCTEVIIKYFHSLLEKYKLDNSTESVPAKKRIKKDYICYVPVEEHDSKINDSKENSKIHLIKNCPPGMIAYKVKSELEKFLERQKIKKILVIGEARSCVSILANIAQQLKDYGFKNVSYKNSEDVLNIRQNIVEAYKLLANNNESLLGWRILENPDNIEERKKHIKNTKTLDLIIKSTPAVLKKIKEEDIINLESEIEEWESRGDNIDEDAMAVERHRQDEEIRKKVLIRQLKLNNLYLIRPLRNLDITVCNVLNSKGLGADVVFLVGFDQGKFPAKQDATKSEIYQMLVALTRAKKRIYLISTVKSKVSGFVDCLDSADINVEEIQIK